MSKRKNEDDARDIFDKALDDPRIQWAGGLGAAGLILPRVGGAIAKQINRAAGLKPSKAAAERLNRTLRNSQAVFAAHGAGAGYYIGGMEQAQQKKGRRK